MKFKIIVAFIFSLSLSACVASPRYDAAVRTCSGISGYSNFTNCVDQEERRLLDIENQKAQENYISSLRNRCLGLGFKPNTDGFSNCIMQLDQNNSQRAAIALQQQQQQEQQQKQQQQTQYNNILYPPRDNTPPKRLTPVQPTFLNGNCGTVVNQNGSVTGYVKCN